MKDLRCFVGLFCLTAVAEPVGGHFQYNYSPSTFDPPRPSFFIPPPETPCPQYNPTLFHSNIYQAQIQSFDKQNKERINKWINKQKFKEPPKQIALNPISDYGFEIKTQGWQGDNLRYYAREFSRIPVEAENAWRKPIVDEGYNTIQTADHAYQVGDSETGDILRDVAKEILNLALQSIPGYAVGVSTYELLSGKEFLTDRILSPEQRAGAALNVLTAGASKWVNSLKNFHTLYQRSGEMAKVYHGAKQALAKAKEVLKDNPKILKDWKKSHRITQIETAEDANARLGSQPPYQAGSHVVHFETTKESHFVRVHKDENRLGSWVAKGYEIKGLTPGQIRDKLNLPETPTHITDVTVPAGQKMSRGMTHFNEWDNKVKPVEGQVQYRMETRVPVSAFTNTRPIGERL